MFCTELSNIIERTSCLTATRLHYHYCICQYSLESHIKIKRLG